MQVHLIDEDLLALDKVNTFLSISASEVRFNFLGGGDGEGSVLLRFLAPPFDDALPVIHFLA